MFEISNIAFASECDLVWSQFKRAHSSFVSQVSHQLDPRYLAGMEQCEFDPNRLPDRNHVEERLQSFGWSAKFVEGYVPYGNYHSMQSQQIFPLAHNVRAAKDVCHSPVPDRIHDLIGHLPLMFSNEYRSLIKRFAELGLQTRSTAEDVALYDANVALSQLNAQEKSSPVDKAQAEQRVAGAVASLERSPSEQTLLERLYFWTVEFGLVGTVEDYRIWGAGLLSSPREGASLIAGNTVIKPFSLSEVLKQSFHISRHQEQLFVVNNLEQVDQAITDLVELQHQGRQQ